MLQLYIIKLTHIFTIQTQNKTYRHTTIDLNFTGSTEEQMQQKKLIF